MGLLFCSTPELSADTVTASWNRNSESNIAGYILSYGTQSGTYSTSIDVGNVTSRQVVLNAGQRYYFVVQAYNTSAQLSPRSAEVFIDVGATTAPSVTSLSPTSGPIGTAVTISGTNFGATQGTSTVRFNGIVATPASWSATRIVAPVPNGATTGPVTVTVAGVASNGLSFTVATGLSSPWLATDIGSPAVGGSATYASGTFTINGAGADIWGTADQFHFAYQPLNGDGEIVAQVASLQNTHAWAKAGVMIRETLTGASRYAFAAVTPGNGLAFLRRVTTGGSSTSTSGGAGTAPYWVRLVRRGSTFSAYGSTTGSSWTLIGSETISMAATVYVGLAVTSHNVSTRATATFTGAAVFGTTTSLPSPWLATDIGSPAVAGSATYASGTFTINGAGADIWGTADQFHFAYQTLNGDGEIVGRVASLQNTHAWAKAGVMIRETLTAASRYAFAAVSAGNGLAFQRRVTTGGSTAITSGGAGAAPYWVRLVRSGSTFSAYRSTTGTSWTFIGSETISMAATVYVGLAVTSHNVSTRATTTFTGAAVFGTTGLPSPWLATDLGSPAVGGSATYASGTFTINGAGADIWGTADQFHFAYRTLNGDGEIVARVASLQNTHAWAKAGVMIRETLTATSRYALAAVSAGNGLAFQRRVTTGGSTAITSGGAGTAPYWMRLVRSGSTFSAYRSTTGTSWTLIGSETISMAATVYVGLAVTSHNVSTGATATFTNAAVVGATTSLTTTSTTSSPLSITNGDRTSGGVATGATADTNSGVSEGTGAVSTPLVMPPSDSEYDGDGKADVTVVTPSTGMWSILESSTGTALTATLGAVGDMPVPGDYDGDGRTDIGVYHPATGEWSILLSSTKYVTSRTVSLGSSGDIPVPGDYDGDAVTDVAVYQPATGQWQILKSSAGYATSIVTLWGATGDIPVPGDYDGDTKTDLAVYRPSTAQWRILQSSTDYSTNFTVAEGVSGDIKVPADYDGDGRTDVAMYRPFNGTWNLVLSTTNYSTSLVIPWGGSNDVPVPADYDGDGKADLALFRSGVWQIRLSNMNYTTSMSVSWGKSGDIPLPNRP